MRASVIRIGNSKGIRIPKPVLEQCGFEEEVELNVRERRLIVSSARSPRQSWDERFREMAERGDDQLLETPPSAWDESQWEWK